MLMSKGQGRVERDILELLRLNEHMSALRLAVLVYQDGGDGRPVTASEHSAVRRALLKLQKQGTVFKLGNMFDERCSYADREHAITIARGLGATAYL